MTGPLRHPNIPSHVTACQTCLDREARKREIRRAEHAARRQRAQEFVDRLMADDDEER